MQILSHFLANFRYSSYLCPYQGNVCNPSVKIDSVSRVFNIHNMQLLKDTNFKGISFDILREELRYSKNFYLIVRMANHNSTKKKLYLNINYISLTHGLKRGVVMTLDFGNYGTFLQSNAFVDMEISFNSGIEKMVDGDRVELVVNDGKIASLLLVRQNNQWYVAEEKDCSSINRDIKKLIEHFEGIDEKFGLSLQNFSVKVEDEFSLKLFCEVLALDGCVPEKRFSIEVAIYDKENNIVYMSSIHKSDGDFKGFEVFSFGTIKLDIPIDEIGKIRFYPTR